MRDGSGVVERGLESPGLRLTRDGGAPRAGDRYEGGLGLPALGDIPEEAEGAVEASAPEPVDPGLYALARRGRGSTHVMPSEPGRLIDIVA